MKYQAFIKRNRRFVGLSLSVVILAALVHFGWRWIDLSSADLTTTAHAQQSIILDQRLNQIEQRFNYIESRLNRLESQSRFPSTLPSSSRDTELNLMRNQMDSMRTEIDALRVRTGELECAVLKLDERTLPPGVRAAKPPTGPSADPCRANPNRPVQFSSRP